MTRKSIYKYILPLENNEIPISIYKNARILKVDNQRENICLWVLVDLDQELEERVFRITGTGHLIDFPIDKYIGTALFLNGSLVWHVFEITKEI